MSTTDTADRSSALAEATPPERPGGWRELTPRARRWIVWILSATMALVLLAVLILPRFIGTRGVHSWNLFHYMIGTKYFDELGYFEIYNATLLADAQNGRVFAKLPSTRDLRTYRIIRTQTALQRARRSNLRARFTKQRWRSFEEDLRAIQKQRSARFWAGPLTDRGFNPSPAWLLVHKPLLSQVRFGNDRLLLGLCYLQIPLFVLTFIGVWWAFGLRGTILFVLWFGCYFGNGPRVFGGYFSYDWFFLTTWSVILYARGRYIAAGPLLAYAAMMRGIPGILALYPALQWIGSVVRWRRPERRHTQFLASLALSALLIFGLTLLQKGGLSTWSSWKDKITLHAKKHELPAERVGMRLIFAQDFQKGRWHMSNPEREKVIARNRSAYRAVAGVLLALFLLTMLRRDDLDGMFLGLGVVFVVLIASRYYWSLAAFFMLWGTFDRRRILNKVSVAYLFGLLILFAVQYFAWKANMRLRWYTFSWGLLLYFVGIALWFAVQDVRWLNERYREWTRSRAGAA
ncbi:MAG: hypothetical protein ABI333_20115 [bacterium]